MKNLKQDHPANSLLMQRWFYSIHRKPNMNCNQYISVCISVHFYAIFNVAENTHLAHIGKRSFQFS